MRRLVLASASPARLKLLRSAGFDPEVIVSGVDEEAVTIEAPHELALVLAARKAEAVASSLEGDALVVGCDSVLDFQGDAVGKPGTAEVAAERWRAMRGRWGLLTTGHHVIDTATGRAAGQAATTLVSFADVTDAEIDAYVATGEPLEVAGGFTIDGRGSLFVDGIQGDHGNVIGLSLPLFRNLLRQLDVEVTELWR